MRRRALTLGILLILVAFFVLEEGALILTPVAEVAGLSAQFTKEVAILPATLYSIPAANYSFAAVSLASGPEYVGSLQVAGGHQVGFYVMDEGNFSIWRTRRPASVILADPNAISYNFTLSPSMSGTYYFVFDNPDNSVLTVLFSLSVVQAVIVVSPFVAYAGYELLVLGAVFSYFGISGGRMKKAETERPKRTAEEGWKCKFCGARNVGAVPSFCSKCGRAQN